ncbi:MAG: GntR family transcriptional regulator [Solirubrobacteraceae bacterium]
MALLETVSVVEALAQRLRERVLDGLIPAGSLVPETEIAAEFGVSRPTAKSAITMLVQAGLLRRDAHRSAYVPTLDREDVLDVYRVRIPLEVEVVRTLAAKASVTPAVEEAVRDFARLPDDVSASRFIAADLRLHRALVEQYGSPRLKAVYESLLGEIHLCMIQTRSELGRERLAREHAAVVDAIRAGDVEAAVAAIRAHLEGACSTLADATARSGTAPA